MHNSENLISYSATISALVGVFRSLHYHQDLSSASLLGQATQKLPPNLKEAWSMHTVKKKWDRPTLLEFNEWLKDKAEAHERMKLSAGKPKTEDSNTPSNVTRTKTGAKVFASTSGSKTSTNGNQSRKTIRNSNCIVCKEKHPLWRCSVFRGKTPTQRAKLVADNKLCFSCMNGQHSFRKCPHPRKCAKEGCSSTHNTLLHGSERIFPPKTNETSDKTRETTANNVTVVPNQAEESPSLPSVTDVKGLLQIAEVSLQSSDSSAKVLVLCDSACSHSWISEKLAKKLNVQGTPTKLTVHGINSHQVIDTQAVELKLTPVHSGGSCSTFVVKPFVRKDLNIGTDFVNVDSLKVQYPHLEPIPLKSYSYGEVEMILGQDVFHSIRPLEYFETDRKGYSTSRPITVGLGIEWSTPLDFGSILDMFQSCC